MNRFLLSPRPATFFSLGAAALISGCMAPVPSQAQPGANPTSATAPTNASTNLEQNFVSPPDAARPWVYWFVMDGNFTREGITADLEAMKKAGIGGVIFMEVNVGIPRGPVQFMSPEWQQLWKHAVKESERLGLEITLNGGPGWAGSGGPWVKPENSMQTTTTSTVDVSGPQHFEGTLPHPPNRSGNTNYYSDIRVLAFPKPQGNQRIDNFNRKSFYDRGHYISEGNVLPFVPSYSSYPALPASEVVNSQKVIDVTAKMGNDGKLSWDVPAGDWTIVRIGATNNGKLSVPAPVPGLGMESDKFSKTALDAHFNDFIGTLMKTVGPRTTKPNVGWNMLHIDSWETGPENWTPAFLEEFKKRRGYDAPPYLPALTGVIVDSREITERFLWDWRQTCGDLVVENHIAHFAELCHQNGFGLSIEAYDEVMPSDISLGGPADVPMAEFWLYEGPNYGYTLPEAASIAHTNGKKIVGAEAFTSGGSEAWKAYPGNMKALGDWAFTEGINRFVIHRYQHQPTLTDRPGMTMGPFGVHWERTQSWWDLSPAYHRYLARCQYLLRQGNSVSDICYLVAEGAPQVFHAPSSATKGSPAEHLGYSFDACAPENLIKNMTVKNGQLTLPDGTSYRVLVLPERDTMTPALLTKISQLVAAGATVIGPRPAKSPSLTNYKQSDATVQRLAAQLWGNCDGLKVTEHRFGKGRVIWRRSGDADLSRERRSPLAGAQWIWYPDNNPSSAAPVGKRYFRRSLTIEDAKQLQSAQMSLTVDNGFTLAVNGTKVGEGGEWHQISSYDVLSQLKSGQNTIDVMGENGEQSPGSTQPNPAGFIGNLRLTFRDGRTLDIPTDAQWQSATEPNAATWNPALSLGNANMGPWNLATTVQPEQYGDFGIVSGVLRGMKVPEDFTSNGPIRYIHRRDGASELFFVANRETSTVSANCTFRVTGKVPELWNPLTGERRALPQYTQQNGTTTVPLRFDALQSWFVVFRSKTASKALAPTAKVNFPTLSTIGTIDGPWQVSFDTKLGGPGEVTFDTLDDWSKRPEPGIKYYSGEAIYRKTFTAPSVTAGTPLYLDLGTVNALAQVKLNGSDLGVVWCAPWQLNLAGKLRPGQNSLEITVANLWPNRLIRDNALPADQRITKTTWNPYQPNTPLLPSGLQGPVTIKQGNAG